VKFSNIKFKQSLNRKLRLTRNRIRRARYYRGHGVHSPYIYAIVRFVFMQKKLTQIEKPFYNQILKLDICPKRAMQLHNLCIHCNYKTLTIDSPNGDICILTTTTSQTNLILVLNSAMLQGTTIVVMNPYADAQREAICRKIISKHKSTTVDNLGFLLIFNNHLPKQHFVI